MNINAISTTMWNTWERCPGSWKLRYHDKLKSKKPEPDYFEFGKFVHKVFEEAAQNERSDIKDIVLKEITNWNFGDNYVPEIPSIVTRFQNFDTHIRAKKKDATSFFERYFDMPIMEDGTRMRGYIDRMMVDDDGALIIDYKTSKAHNQKNKNSIKNDRQLQMYVLAASRLLEMNVENIIAGLYYVTTGKFVTVSFLQKHIDKMIHDCKAVINEIKNTSPDEVRFNPGRHCKWCDYEFQCKAYDRYKKIYKRFSV